MQASYQIRTKFPPGPPKRIETRAHAPQKRASRPKSRHDGPNDQKRERVHRRRRRRAHQDQIPRPTAQTTRNESACTAEARIRARLPKFDKSLKKNTGFIGKMKKMTSEFAPGFQKREIS